MEINSKSLLLYDNRDILMDDYEERLLDNDKYILLDFDMDRSLDDAKHRIMIIIEKDDYDYYI